jgi:hypothetical protein
LPVSSIAHFGQRHEDRVKDFELDRQIDRTVPASIKGFSDRLDLFFSTVNYLTPLPHPGTLFCTGG